MNEIDQATESIAPQCNALHAKLAGLAKMSPQVAIEIGGLLHQQKSTLQHGEFGLWADANLSFKRTSAARYMKLYFKRDELPLNADLGIDEAYRLLTEPPQAQTLLHGEDRLVRDKRLRDEERHQQELQERKESRRKSSDQSQEQRSQNHAQSTGNAPDFPKAESTGNTREPSYRAGDSASDFTNQPDCLPTFQSLKTQAAKLDPCSEDLDDLIEFLVSLKGACQ